VTADPAHATISNLRKAAILLVILGEEAAARIYKNLSDEQLQAVTQEIAEMGTVSPQVGTAILEEFHGLTVTQEYLTQGGKEYATKLLIRAFGEEGARTLLDQVLRSQQISASKLDSLRKADPQHLAKFLESEHPQTIALILAHLDSRQASALLMKLPEACRADAITRLANLRQFSPDMAQKVSVVLHKRLQSIGEQSRRTYAGFSSVADLMNCLDAAAAKEILEAIEKQDAQIALSIRNLMFTFDDFLTIPASNLRELLGPVDKKTLATALKGAGEELQSHFFKSMSSRAVEMLKEDIEALGPVRSREISKAQQEIVAAARKLESEGKMTLKSEGEDEYVV